jgi:hypothetical protein
MTASFICYIEGRKDDGWAGVGVGGTMIAFMHVIHAKVQNADILPLRFCAGFRQLKKN